MTTINNVSSVNSYYNTQNTTTPKASEAKTSPAANSADVKASETKAAVYEAGTQNKDTKKIYKRDTETINRLLQEAEQRKQQLKDLVERTLGKQSEIFTFANFNKFATGEIKLSDEEIAQAKEDISEDGYWGVKQTSERLYSFAYALAGGDPSKADDMMAAIEKGYEQATKAWGKELPEISKQTLEATREKIDAWKNANAGIATEV